MALLHYRLKFMGSLNSNLRNKAKKIITVGVLFVVCTIVCQKVTDIEINLNLKLTEPLLISNFLKH